MSGVREYRSKGLSRGRAARQVTTTTTTTTISLDCSARALISRQHKSLAKLAGQSVRRLNTSSSSSTTTTTKRNFCYPPAPPSCFTSDMSDITILMEEGPNKKEEEKAEEAPTSSRKVQDSGGGAGDAIQSPIGVDSFHVVSSQLLPLLPPPTNRRDSDSLGGMDDVSLENLCKQVSGMMSGREAPAPKAPQQAASPPIQRANSDFDMDQVDVEMQFREMRRLEEIKEQEQRKASQEKERESKKEAAAAAAAAASGLDDKIEVSPGEFLPLFGSNKTFESFVSGQFCVAKCFECMQDMMIAASVDLVICKDCWVLSPVGSNNNSGRPPASVGIGVKSEEMKQWLDW